MTVMFNIKVHTYSIAKRGFSFLYENSKLRELTPIFQCIPFFFSPLYNAHPLILSFQSPQGSIRSYFESCYEVILNSHSWNSCSCKVEVLGDEGMSLMGLPCIAAFRFRCWDTKAQEPSPVAAPLGVLPWNFFPWRKLDFCYCLQYKYFIAMRIWAQIHDNK